MAGLPMEKILNGRGCLVHPCCPKPCVQCAGMALSYRDQAKGGYGGALPRFEEDPADKPQDSESALISADEVRSTVSRWGRQKQLHAVG